MVYLIKLLTILTTKSHKQSRLQNSFAKNLVRTALGIKIGQQARHAVASEYSYLDSGVESSTPQFEDEFELGLLSIYLHPLVWEICIYTYM